MQTVTAWFEKNDLFYTFDLPISTTLADLISQISTAMQNSDSNFSFASAPSHLSFVSNEVLPLQVLEFGNRGLQRPQDQQIRLRRAAFNIPDPTISDLLTDRYRFAIPKLAIDGNNRFVLHFSELYSHHPVALPDVHIHSIVTRSHPLTGLITFDGDEVARLHTCLSAKFFHSFPLDRADNSYDPLHEPSSDSEDDTEEEAEVIRQVQASRRSQRLAQAHTSSRSVRFATEASIPTSTSTSTTTSTSTSDPTHRAPNATVNPLRPRRTFDLLESVPSKPWSTNWTPTPGRYSGTITSGELKVDQAYALAVKGNQNDGLHLSSLLLGAIADEYRQLLGDAAESGDFTEVLQPERSFAMWVQLIS